MQQYVKSRRFETMMEATPMIGIKAPTTTLSTCTLLSYLRNKNVDEETINELIKGKKKEVNIKAMSKTLAYKL